MRVWEKGRNRPSTGVERGQSDKIGLVRPFGFRSHLHGGDIGSNLLGRLELLAEVGQNLNSNQRPGGKRGTEAGRGERERRNEAGLHDLGIKLGVGRCALDEGVDECEDGRAPALSVVLAPVANHVDTTEWEMRLG